MRRLSHALLPLSQLLGAASSRLIDLSFELMLKLVSVIWADGFQTYVMILL